MLFRSIYLGRISNSRVYDPSGQYAGTICGDCVVYRSSDSATISSFSISANRVGSAAANTVASVIWGDEPNFPD